MTNTVSIDDLIEILGQTIKKDDINKVLVFLAMLLVYTEDSQINISFIAPSSSGKSFIPLEVSKFFPQEDLMKLGSASPTSFYHEQGKYEDENDKSTITVDLSRKIIIFMDQPGPELLARFRALLSHDEKVIISKITDKNQRGGNRTKTVKIIGFPVVIFCSANLHMDEQESTRMLVLSPEVDDEKIKDGIREGIKKATDKASYNLALESNPKRQALKKLVLDIKEAGIKDVKIINPDLIEKKFFELNQTLRPRQQRDIGRVINLIKSITLLNFNIRERAGDLIVATEKDIEDGFMLWELVSESQKLDLSPYLYDFYQKVILPLFVENPIYFNGVMFVTIKNIQKKHNAVFGRAVPQKTLIKAMLPQLESVGLISLDKDPTDGRKQAVFPTTQDDISGSINGEKHIEHNGGVTNIEAKNWSCGVCENNVYWVRPDGGIVCEICHPQLHEEINEHLAGLEEENEQA